ncbi:uncharacterized protein [Dendrobates tinctorius]|uniref:uncharacterized protein isoform X5 n=1 Tax=Dendrobates tinctorius TaxID=92724 RepID=UPI003CC936E8
MSSIYGTRNVVPSMRKGYGSLRKGDSWFQEDEQKEKSKTSGHKPTDQTTTQEEEQQSGASAETKGATKAGDFNCILKGENRRSSSVSRIYDKTSG